MKTELPSPHGEWLGWGLSAYRQCQIISRTTPSPAKRGRDGVPLKKADAFFKGTRGGGVKNRAATLPIYIHHSRYPVCKTKGQP